ncbi:unnamed protein product [Acanthoscelides obtectus]|uniref:Uncharacterized protein n=1 Tax=Acanthoscelides obtectus TaxID=200917 RepID=A0A9P0L0D5_ACAOB|nr:unnamed protein product [Acanthoscelides obtectus]CAK1660686.1 hypothetical protein AOBTE_LOCUS22219 [Acanthoscelides obtectus]
MNKEGFLEMQKVGENLQRKKTVDDVKITPGLSLKVSSESVKNTWSNDKLGKTSSGISLTKKNSYLDLSLKDKLVQMPLRGLENRKEISKSHSCPWQNFNLEEKHIYHKIRPVNNISLELYKNNKKSILKRPKVPKPQITRSTLMEVKFNKAAAMMIHPSARHNVMRQARINLSTNTRHTVGDNTIFRKPSSDFQVPKVITNRKKKYFEEDGRGHFWYISKKPKIV